MGLLFRHEKTAEKDRESHNTLIRARDGDIEARNKLIELYTPFILRVAAKVSGRYIRIGEDDEVSIGMMAFNEAINSFNEEKSIAFLTFAETVIRRRLIDYYRKEKSNKKYIPFSSFENNTDENSEQLSINYIEGQKSMEEFQQKSEEIDRKEEIVLYSKVLMEFGISFSELVNISPKHEDARLRSMEMAKLIVQDKELINQLLNKKELPIKQILTITNISRKTLERQRKYIIAVVLILINDFEHLKGYIEKSL